MIFNSRAVPAPQVVTPPIPAPLQVSQAAHPIDSNTHSGFRDPKKPHEAAVEDPETLLTVGAAAAAPPNRRTSMAMQNVVTTAAPVKRMAAVTSAPTALRVTVPATASKDELEKKRKRDDNSEEEDGDENRAVPSIPVPRNRTSHPEAKKTRMDYQETSGEEDEPLATARKGKGRSIQVNTSTKARRSSKAMDYVEVSEEEDEDEEMAPPVKRKATYLETKRNPQKRGHPVEESDSEDYGAFHSDDSEAEEPSGIDLKDLKGPCDHCIRREQVCVTENLATNRTCSFCKSQKRHCSLRDKRKAFFQTKEGYQWLKDNGHIRPIATKTKHTTTLTGKGKAKEPAIKVERVKAEKPPKRTRAAATTSRPAAAANATAGPSRSTRSTKVSADAKSMSPVSKPAAAASRPKPRPTSKRVSEVQGLEEGIDSGTGEYSFILSS